MSRVQALASTPATNCLVACVMENSVQESGVLKRKQELDVTLKTKESDLNSPPAKIRATDEKGVEQEPSKASALSHTSPPNQTISTENSAGEKYDEREKMQ